ncbi:MAG: S8 family serine peptidase [Nocardioides sp.]
MSRLRTRLTALTCAAAAVLSTSGVTTAATGSTAPTSTGLSAAGLAARPGLQLLLSDAAPRGFGIATFDSVPTPAQVDQLIDLGLVVQPMKRLPLAIVGGTDTALRDAVAAGVARDVYPNETLAYDDTASSNVMSSTPQAATALRKQGFTGKGVTVGIVDSGCDGTHPDLTQRIEHNVTLVSAEYVNQAPDESNTLVVPAAIPGYANSDIGSGHGTHVAGIVAADGTSGKDFLGVAPDAKLACFGIGAVITTTAVVTAYDYMLRQPKMLGIDVINNSWGNSFRQYDPKDPVNVATKAVTDKGAVVVFSAGNSGYENGESSVSPFNQAPWVISVAASDLQRKRGSFSSNGLRFDNGRPTAIGKGGHTVFTGDRIGNTMPDVSGPGVDISSSCDSAGSVIGPCPTHGNTEASGTSMSSPHIAGAAAVLVGANPNLTPAQVQDALKATASPMTAEGERLDSWQVGYGHVNLDRAVDLVRGRGWGDDLRVATRKADRRLSNDDPWAVTRADLWQDDAPPLAAGGSYSATRKVSVTRGTDALKITLVYPTPGTAANLASVTATVLDKQGKVVGQTETNLGYSIGLANAMVRGLKPGDYTVLVEADYEASDPDTLDSDSINGRVIFLQAAQLRKR